MNSFNHYAYGSIGEWLNSVVAGISELQPGFKRILLCPIPHKNHTRASASLHTPYGLISSARKRVGKSIEWAVTVPPNTLAVAVPPTRNADAVRIGKKHWDDAEGASPGNPRGIARHRAASRSIPFKVPVTLERNIHFSPAVIFRGSLAGMSCN